jgi:lipoprotein-anchoring transpeptidase ErfK/SrfK
VKFSRRDFLKLSGLSLTSALLPPAPPDEAPRAVERLGRAIKGLHIYERPSLTAKTVALITAETVFNIYATVLSDDESYNRTWYQVRRGFVYSGQVQPVRWQWQTPSLDVPADGVLGEITVPYTISKTGPNANFASVARFYYSTTHWIVSAKADPDGVIWYEAFDERLNQSSWLKAEHVHRVTEAEIAPISPDVPGERKRIEVDLAKQTFQCFENGVKLLDILCSTGPYLRTQNGQRVYGTPSGDWAVNRKRPTRHMAGDDFASADFFDLPGVPWVSYFHWWGVSIHGTYWHNDYGKPRSHGCINLPAEAAKWVFRWSLPRGALSQKPTTGDGTPVIVY